MTQKNRINIFWIEDNPLQSKFKKIDEIKFPSFKLKITDHVDDLFSFKLFQHPEEVKEYLSIVCELNEKDLSARFSEKCGDALPDIVVFDYKLSDNFGTRNGKALQYTNDSQLSYLKDHSASLSVKKAFKEEFSEKVLFLERESVRESKYSSDEFKKEIGATTINLNDEFGLYCGISIIREFKNYITVGVPATFNKRDKTDLSENSLFYEWLNSYDINDAIERFDKGNKEWDDIVKFALPLLRNRIENQIKSGKIIPSYYQLIKLTDENGSDEKVFSFISTFGERHLALEGLFIDGTKTVNDWAKDLLKIFAPKSDDINEAINVSNILWEKYCTEFEKRIQLSDLTYRERTAKLALTEKKSLELNPKEKEELKKLKKHFKLNSENLIGKELSIRTLIPNPKGKQKNLRPAKNAIFRLALLHLVTKAAIAMNKCREHAPEKEVYRNLDSYEYFNLLFPLVNLRSDLILPMHEKDSVKKGDLIETDTTRLRERLLINQGDRLEGDWHEFEKWIEDGEKILLRAIYFNDNNYYPIWLQ